MPANGNGNSRNVEVKQACTVLYDKLPLRDADTLQAALRPLVGDCAVEWADSADSDLPIAAGATQFGPHRIAMLALDAPVTQETLARTVDVSPMPEDLRVALMGHRAAIRLLYVGEASSALDQLTALYQVAGVLLAQDGLGILNERAALAQPAELVSEYLPHLGGKAPPLPLWVGVVTYEREDEGPARQYLMRTYGMEQFDLPELAFYMPDRTAADEVYHVLINVGLYMVEGLPNLKLEPGHTVEFLKRTYLLTEPKSDEQEFASPISLLLLVEV